MWVEAEFPSSSVPDRIEVDGSADQSVELRIGDMPAELSKAPALPATFRECRAEGRCTEHGATRHPLSVDRR